MSSVDLVSMFDNSVKVEWLEDNSRNMRLLESVCFIDSEGRPWVARAGSVVDGASIPRFFWRFIGSPFVGKYRRPSVIHDVYCVSKDKPHREVHEMFYEAMLAEGVPKAKARAMYWAVRLGGPKWP